MSKKRARYDCISQILLNASVNTCIINQSIIESLITGTFPNELIIAKIILIFKKDNKHDFNNYGK